jgi:hypothetical protein
MGRATREPLGTEFNKEKDLFGFPSAETDGYEGFRIKHFEKKSLTWEQIETMTEALQPPSDE